MALNHSFIYSSYMNNPHTKPLPLSKSCDLRSFLDKLASIPHPPEYNVESHSPKAVDHIPRVTLST